MSAGCGRGVRVATAALAGELLAHVAGIEPALVGQELARRDRLAADVVLGEGLADERDDAL